MTRLISTTRFLTTAEKSRPSLAQEDHNSNLLPFPPMIVKEPVPLSIKEDSPTVSRNAAYWSLFVLLAINILNFYDRQVAGAVAEPMRKEFSLNDTQLGWINTAFTILYGIVSLPLGWLADKSSRKKLLSG